VKVKAPIQGIDTGFFLLGMGKHFKGQYASVLHTQWLVAINCIEL
jgi:hypothetical protein